MSIKKADISGRGYKNPIRGTQWLLTGVFKFLLQMAFFFLILWGTLQFYDITANNWYYFIFIFFNYVVSGFLAFFGAYAIFSVLCWLIKYKPDPIQPYIQGHRKLRNLCIYILILLVQSVLFVWSAYLIVAGMFPFKDIWSYILAWVIIAIFARFCGYFIYYIASHFKFQI